jgi:hypothetical protein
MYVLIFDLASTKNDVDQLISELKLDAVDENEDFDQGTNVFIFKLLVLSITLVF